MSCRRSFYGWGDTQPTNDKDAVIGKTRLKTACFSMPLLSSIDVGECIAPGFCLGIDELVTQERPAAMSNRVVVNLVRDTSEPEGRTSFRSSGRYVSPIL